MSTDKTSSALFHFLPIFRFILYKSERKMKNVTSFLLLTMDHDSGSSSSEEELELIALAVAVIAKKKN